MKMFNKKMFYVAASFIAGFSVMTVELISSRIVAPIIGSSVFTWTSVIGITLFGLSIGSWVGGILADKVKNESLLSLSFLISSFFIFLIPLLSKNTDFLINSSNSILWLNLFLSGYLFLLPAVSIGTIQPIILKNFADDFSKIGNRYGILSAFWSIGSVVGVFLTGFVFISTIGSAKTIFIVSIIMLLMGIFFLNKSARNIKIYIVIIFLALVSFYFLERITVTKTTIFQKETNYYNAKIVDAYIPNFGKSRILFLDVDSHSIESETINQHFYPEIYPVFYNLKKDIGEILVIGGGAYTIPKHFREFYKNSNISVIEMDPELKKIGENYFDLKNYNINTIIGDARVIINKDPKKYDLIFGDAYNSFISVPWYLLTKEWNDEVRSKLTDNGIYAINFIGSIIGDKSEITKSVLNTFKLSFPNFYTFVFGTSPEKTQNIILIGINGELPVKESELYTKLKNDNNFLAEKITKMDDFSMDLSTILMDDFAPVEKLMGPIMIDYLPKNIDFLKNVEQNLYRQEF